MRAHTLAFPKDTHFVPGYPPERPLVMNYAHVPRVYPPGVFLLGAPSALLYHYGLISFGASNRLFIAILVLMWLAGVLAWTAPWRELPPSILRQLLTAVAAAYSWYWAMEGFYDAFAVGLASLGLEAGRRRRHALGSLCGGLTVLIHPRLFMLAPLFVLEFFDAARTFRAQTWRERAALVTGCLLFAAGLAYAVLIQRTASLHALVQPPNPLRPGSGPWWVVLAFAALLVGLSMALFRAGSRADVAVVLFSGLAFAWQRYLAPWYWLPLLPWAMAPARSPAAAPAMSKVGALARALLVGSFFLASNVPRWWA